MRGVPFSFGEYIFRRKFGLIMSLKRILNFICVAVAAECAAVSSAFAENSALALQDLKYSDSRKSLNNPGRGWYRTQGLRLKESDNKAVGISQPLTHLRVDISAFSEKGLQSIDSSKTPRDTIYGVSKPLTDDALAALNSTFANAREKGNKVIVRTSYDIDGRGKQDPPQKIILGHIKQLAEVYGKNSDVITYVELGMYGSWGEQHTSNNGSNAEIAEALQTMIVNTPSSIKVGVRRPDIVAYWLGVQSETRDDAGNITKVGYENFDINSDVFKAAVKAKGDTIYRVGMYNDGYLGSTTDLGTVTMGNPKLTREMMVSWLEQYSLNTPYGGEMVANYNGDHPMNTARYLSYEGFRTHTSYLNWEWHYETIQNMKDSILGPEFGKGFRAPDSEYVGATAYKYVEDHLGYRFVLRESWLPDSLYDDTLFRAKFKIQNVGFGNLTKSASAKLVFIEDVDPCDVCPAAYEMDISDVFDLRKVYGRSIVVDGSDTTLTFDGMNEFTIEGKSSRGKYDVVLQVEGISFANVNESIFMCEKSVDGLYLGKTYVRPKDIQGPTSLGIKNLHQSNTRNNQPMVFRNGYQIKVRGGELHGGKTFQVNGKIVK